MTQTCCSVIKIGRAASGFIISRGVIGHAEKYAAGGLPSGEKRIHASFDAGEPSPQPTGSPPLVVIAAITFCQKGFCRTSRGRPYALVQPRFGELPIGGEAARRVFRKLIQGPSMFVRILAELFAVIPQPIATMLLVHRDSKQSDAIAVVIN
jgi:hypothetical protein